MDFLAGHGSRFQPQKRPEGEYGAGIDRVPTECDGGYAGIGIHHAALSEQYQTEHNHRQQRQKFQYRSQHLHAAGFARTPRGMRMR